MLRAVEGVEGVRFFDGLPAPGRQAAAGPSSGLTVHGLALPRQDGPWFPAAPAASGTPVRTAVSYEEKASGSRPDPGPELMAKFPDTSLDYVLPCVYHGTSEKNAEAILRNGFQEQRIPSYGRRFGYGFYFAEREKSARIWSRKESERGTVPKRGVGPVIKASIQGRVAFVDEPKMREAVDGGNLNSFPHVASEEELTYLRSLLERQYPPGMALSAAAVGIFLKSKGYSAMYLHPWREIVVFDASAITDMEILAGDVELSAGDAPTASE